MVIILLCSLQTQAKEHNPSRTIVFTTVGDAEVPKGIFRGSVLGDAKFKSLVHENGKYFAVYSKDISVIENHHREYYGVTAYITKRGSIFNLIPKLESVILPDTIEEIESSVFEGCSNLKSISFPPSLKIIGDEAFDGCNKLIIAEIPPTIKKIGYRAFEGVSIINACLSKVHDIGSDAFRLATITNLELPNSSFAAFSGAIIKRVEISDYNQRIIGAIAKADTVRVKEGTKAIRIEGSGKAIIQYLYLPASLTSEQNNSIAGVQVENVCFSEGLKVVPKGLCVSQKRLKHVTFPLSVQIIEERAFYGCNSLEDVILPAGLRELGNSCFSYCDALTSIVIPESVETIGDESFYGCRKLKQALLPPKIKEISGGCFRACSSLETIEIPNGVTHIKDEAFSSCINLKKVNLPETLRSIGVNAFYGCDSLKEVVFPASINEIGEGAFWNCSNLLPIDIKETLFTSKAFPKKLLLEKEQEPIWVGSYKSNESSYYFRIEIGRNQFSFISPSGEWMEVGSVRNGKLYSIAGDEWGTIDTKEGKYVIFQNIMMYRYR